MAKSKYTWFIEPLDAHTNGAFAKEIPGENFFREVVCEDGQKRNLWQCPRELVAAFWESRNDLELRFRIYNQTGRGRIRNVNFLFKRKKKKHVRRRKKAMTI